MIVTRKIIHERQCPFSSPHLRIRFELRHALLVCAWYGIWCGMASKDETCHDDGFLYLPPNVLS